jgi:hypothetical protein
MITHIFILAMCINGSLYMVTLDGSPFVTDIQGDCFVIDADIQSNVTNLAPDTDNTTLDQLQSNMTNPESGGTIFDPITQTLERSADTIDTMINLATGGYILNLADRVMIQCSLDADPNSDTYQQYIPESNPVWDAFKLMFRGIIVVLTSLTIFYWISGRGHILSS